MRRLTEFRLQVGKRGVYNSVGGSLLARAARNKVVLFQYFGATRPVWGAFQYSTHPCKVATEINQTVQGAQPPYSGGALGGHEHGHVAVTRRAIRGTGSVHHTIGEHRPTVQGVSPRLHLRAPRTSSGDTALVASQRGLISAARRRPSGLAA